MEMAFLIFSDVTNYHIVNSFQQRKKDKPRRPCFGSLQAPLCQSALTQPGSVLAEQILANHF